MTEQKLGHPAKFSDRILEVIDREALGDGTIIDPFAGTGRVHELASVSRFTRGIEIEAEWASMHPDTICGDTLDYEAWGQALDSLPGEARWFDHCVTSVTYGNRMADKHEAKDGSHRNTYRHMLGRPLTQNNSGGMQWGPEYRDFHRQAWQIITEHVNESIILNVSDHIRAGERQCVVAWHVRCLNDLGWRLVDIIPVATPRNKFGANASSRVDAELVLVFA